MFVVSIRFHRVSSSTPRRVPRGRNIQEFCLYREIAARIAGNLMDRRTGDEIKHGFHRALGAWTLNIQIWFLFIVRVLYRTWIALYVRPIEGSGLREPLERGMLARQSSNNVSNESITDVCWLMRTRSKTMFPSLINGFCLSLSEIVTNEDCQKSIIFLLAVLMRPINEWRRFQRNSSILGVQ